MKRPLALVFVSALCAWAGLSGCVTMFELEGYVDAAGVLCACPGFEKVENCAVAGNKRLSNAPEAERQAWLVSYEARKCGTACEYAAACYGDLPGCQGKKPGCECCIWNDAVIECTPATCQSSRSCFELATVVDDGTKKPGVSARALLADLQKCACSSCASDCIGFCQSYEVLQGAGDTCTPCLETTCKPQLDACLADKP